MGERKKEKGEWRWLAHRPTTLKLRWINSLGVDGRKEKGKRRMEMACPSSNYTKVTMD